MVTEAQRDGPTLNEYVETRLNLAKADAEKTEAALRERINAVEKTATDGLKHQKEITGILKESTDKAGSKADETQARVNLASNEWRSTVTDINNNKAPLAAVTRLEVDFAAYKLEKAQELSNYKLEVQRTVAAVVAQQIADSGIKTGVGNARAESHTSTVTIIGIAAVVATLASIVAPRLFRDVPVQVVAPSSQQFAIPQGYMLVPSQQSQTPK
ncbi:MAG: hypothetical protein ABI831_06840 [Betaproteobacteria bacterium]